MVFDSVSHLVSLKKNELNFDTLFLLYYSERTVKMGCSTSDEADRASISHTRKTAQCKLYLNRLQVDDKICIYEVHFTTEEIRSRIAGGSYQIQYSAHSQITKHQGKIADIDKKFNYIIVLFDSQKLKFDMVDDYHQYCCTSKGKNLSFNVEECIKSKI